MMTMNIEDYTSNLKNSHSCMLFVCTMIWNDLNDDFEN